MASTYEDVQAAVVAKIRSLNLDGLDPSRVYNKLSPSDVNMVYPCVAVFIQGLGDKLREQAKPFSALHVWNNYPVAVAVLRRGDVADDSQKGPYLTWRDAIVNAFPVWIPTVAGGLKVTVDTGAVVEAKGPSWLQVTGSLVLWVEVTRSR